jgi:outer membrane protein insertion porin family
MKPGTKINNNLVSSLQNKIPQEYIAKGFADAKINIQEKANAEILIWWTGQLKWLKVKKLKLIKLLLMEIQSF